MVVTTEMDETFASALRDLLVEQINEPRARGRWSDRPRRWITAAGVVLVLAATGGGISYAAGVWSTAPLPGGNALTDLSTPVVVTGAGSQTVNLGPRPAGVTSINMAFACLTPGAFTFADGASVSCGRADSARRSPTATYTMRLAPGQDTTKITAEPGARWRLVATYVSVKTTAWDTNASGQTYGVQNEHGVPDLIAVIATNHRTGYVYANQLNPPPPKTIAQALAQSHAPPKTLTVYKSDGKTPIGVFTVGN
jgi:hypothetical protein